MFDLSQMGDLMNRAKEMQKQLKADLETLAIHGSSGGGMVKVIINGNKELSHIEIDPGFNGDTQMLADMVLAAMNAAYTEADKVLKERMSGMFGGLDMSQISNMFGS